MIARGGGAPILDKTPQVHVGASRRAGRLWHRLYTGLCRRERRHLPPGSVLLTLTLPAGAGKDGAQQAWRRLRLAAKRAGYCYPYVRVPEVQGAMHYHVVMYTGVQRHGRGWLPAGALEWYRRAWRRLTGSVWVQVTACYGDGRRLASYLGKYLSKGGAGRWAVSADWAWRGMVRDWRHLLRWADRAGCERSWVYAMWGYACEVGPAGLRAWVSEARTWWRAWCLGYRAIALTGGQYCEMLLAVERMGV